MKPSSRISLVLALALSANIIASPAHAIIGAILEAPIAAAAGAIAFATAIGAEVVGAAAFNLEDISAHNYERLQNYGAALGILGLIVLDTQSGRGEFSPLTVEKAQSLGISDLTQAQAAVKQFNDELPNLNVMFDQLQEQIRVRNEQVKLGKAQAFTNDEIKAMTNQDASAAGISPATLSMAGKISAAALKAGK